MRFACKLTRNNIPFFKQVYFNKTDYLQMENNKTIFLRVQSKSVNIKEISDMFLVFTV